MRTTQDYSPPSATADRPPAHPDATSARVRGVVIVSPGGLTGGGGMGTVTRTLKQWFNQHRPAMGVAVLDPRGESGAGWSAFYLPMALARLVYLGIVRRYGVLHLQVSERMSFARKGALLWTGRTLGMRVVLHHHGAELIPFYLSASPRMQSLVRWVVHAADVNIVLGQVWRDFLVDQLQLPADRIVVRFNATNDMADNGPRHVEDPWHFLIMANLSPRKGVGELLQAVAALAKSGAPVRLTLAGGGEVERYRADAHALGIADRCVFTGWIKGDEVARLMLSCSALVLPSYNEGLPMTIIEALSARVPVIATPVGSIPEVLEDGVNCLFVQPGNVGEIAAAMRRIASDAEVRRGLMANGRELYERQFSVDTYMKDMIELYLKPLS